MMRVGTRVICFSALAALFMAIPASAGSIFPFLTGTLSGSGFGNTMTLSDDGVSLTVSSWGIGSTPTFTPGQIKVWSTGLGTCNMDEGLNCETGPHAADNRSEIDAFLLQFDQKVIPDVAQISAWTKDFDVSFWGGSGMVSLSGKTFADLATQYDSLYSGPNASDGQFRDVDLSPLGAPVDWLVIGARVSNTDHYDRFKLARLETSVPVPVPASEPGTLLLIGAGLLGIARLTKRSKKHTG